MERLVLFAKRPVLGRVKTRLVPPLTAKHALLLYRAFVCDQLRFVASLAGPTREVEVCLDGKPGDAASFRPPGDLLVTSQGPGDLGERMHRAFTRACEAGARSTVIVGADAPSLPRSLVEAAYARLRAGDRAVVVPAEDGGYVLIGLREPISALFRAIPWGGPEVLATTRARAATSGTRLCELGSWHDVDTADDLVRLAADLVAAPDRAPVTARVLSRIAS